MCQLGWWWQWSWQLGLLRGEEAQEERGKKNSTTTKNVLGGTCKIERKPDLNKCSVSAGSCWVKDDQNHCAHGWNVWQEPGLPAVGTIYKCLAAVSTDRRAGTHKGCFQSDQQWPSVESRVCLDQYDWIRHRKNCNWAIQAGSTKDRVFPFFRASLKIYWEDASNSPTGVFALQVWSWVIYIHSGKCDTYGGLDSAPWKWNLQEVPETYTCSRDQHLPSKRKWGQISNTIQ